jgi:hypothetical protein
MENKERLNHYDHFEVLERFNIKKNQTCSTLKAWLNATGTFTASEEEIMQ